jgi:hypothetical protein
MIGQLARFQRAKVHEVIVENEPILLLIVPVFKLFCYAIIEGFPVSLSPGFTRTKDFVSAGALVPTLVRVPILPKHGDRQPPE